MLVGAPLLNVEQELRLRGDGGAAGELAAPGPGLGLELDVGLLVPGLEAHSLGLAARAAAAAHRPGLLPLCTVLLQLGLDIQIHSIFIVLNQRKHNRAYLSCVLIWKVLLCQ